VLWGREMQISAETRNALKTFGLTGYEIQTYTALLERGRLTASEVSEASEVPYSKIYEVLGSLERKGWVETELGRPNAYYAKPPVEAVETSKLMMENLLKVGEKRVTEDLQPIYEGRENRERPDIWIVRGEFNILARIGEVCSRAQEELLVAIPFLSEALLKVFEPTFGEVKQRGVPVHLLAIRGTDRASIEELKRFGRVRLRDQMFGGGVVSDSKEVLLTLGGEKDQSSALAIWSNHLSLAKFAKNYFEYLWREGEECDKLRNP